MSEIKCACIKCLMVLDPKIGQRCPICGGEIRPIKDVAKSIEKADKKARGSK